MNSRLCISTTAIALVGLAGVSAAVITSGCRGSYSGLAEGGDFLTTGRTLSHFSAVQIDPPSEDSAGPQFVVAADLDADGLVDLASAWNQSQPVQIHLQRRDAAGAISFKTITLAGSIPVVAVAGLAVEDFDDDGHLDIAVLAKETLLDGPECLVNERPDSGLSGLVLLYLGPSDPALVNRALAWEEVPIGASFLQGAGDAVSTPEVGGYTSMAAGDVDLDFDVDLVVAWNSACGDNGTTAVVVFTNGGATAVRDGTWTASKIADPFPQGTAIKDVAFGDIDRDGDLDVVATLPGARTMNVRWFRNPVIDIPDDYHISDGGWQVGVVAQIATGADLVRLEDIDDDGITDVVVRSTAGRVIQWLKGPDGPTSGSMRAIPWQVFTIAEFTERAPEAIAVGNLDSDEELEVIASAEGGLVRLDPRSASAVFDQWTETLIIDEHPDQDRDADLPATDPNVAPEEAEASASTAMNSILVTDLDGDGANDLVVTLDRGGLSGLANDALVWFRNTLRRP